MSQDARKKIESLFPSLSEIPADADFAPGGGSYDEGNRYLQ